MASVLQVEYKDTLYPDISFIDLKELEVQGDKTYNFKLVNKPDEKGNNYDTEQIKFKTNMDPKVYKIEHPDKVSIGQKSAVRLTIFTEDLFNDTSRDIFDEKEQRHYLQMQFDYKKVRTFR